uniref:Uncharacterized protein n=1 Tax=Arion vulgaris TaxID=1028688 RepID=A0A0B6ZIR0_9EUPU
MGIMSVIISVISIFLANYVAHAVADGAVGHVTLSNGEQIIDFDRLRQLLEILDYHLQDVQRRTCQLGLHSQNCELVDLEKLKHFGNVLRSGESPSKRDGGLDYEIPENEMTNDELRAANAVLEDLVEQRRAIHTLKKLLSSLKSDLDDIKIKKKDCRFRLGGHCLTESLDRAANQYYYLKSPNSPGRRRRRNLEV